jgi:ribokinase
MAKILNFGSINYDHVYSVENFVRPEETIAATKYTIAYGGKGLNQSIALARAGARVYHAGAVGKSDGAAILQALTTNGVNIDFVEQKDCSSGHAIIQVNSRGQNCIMIWGGANREISEEQIERTLQHFDAGDYLVLQNETNLLEHMIRLGRERKMTIVLNPSPMTAVISSLPLDEIDLLIMNEVEAQDICGLNAAPENLLQVLSERYPDTMIVLTLGSRGVYCKKGAGETAYNPAYQVEVVDTTAAGDTFSGYFIAAIARGETISEALRQASTAAAIAVTRFGAEPSIPEWKEVVLAKLAPVTESQER